MCSFDERSNIFGFWRSPKENNEGRDMILCDKGISKLTGGKLPLVFQNDFIVLHKARLSRVHWEILGGDDFDKKFQSSLF